jgi:hypothetical protein
VEPGFRRVFSERFHYVFKQQVMSKFTFRRSMRLTAIAYVVTIAGILSLANSCNKSKPCDAADHAGNQTITTSGKNASHQPVSQTTKQGSFQTSVVRVVNVRELQDGSSAEVMLAPLAELFTVSDATMIATFKDARAANKMVVVTVDPWRAVVLQVSLAKDAPVNTLPNKTQAGEGRSFDLTRTPTDVDNPSAIGALNTTTGSLVNVIPDMATAQLMFDYITHQCCAVPGPYTIDYCISFQYCEDGCYARAHKMCWILNNKYNYATHKIFSFANAGSDRLSVRAEKWGGCCITWWYHVAPLVNIKTPAGVKAYVFDPAMFDQPVLLSEWLHAQANPVCSGTAHVSMINIQPTASYSPASYSGYSFDTDPTYSSTNSTLVSYSTLHTCP